MKELLESLWMEGWHSCDGAGSDTPDINIEDYKEEINSAIKQYLASEIFGLDSTLYDRLNSIREEKDQMVEKGILK